MTDAQVLRIAAESRRVLMCAISAPCPCIFARSRMPGITVPACSLFRNSSISELQSVNWCAGFRSTLSSPTEPHHRETSRECAWRSICLSIPLPATPRTELRENGDSDKHRRYGTEPKTACQSRTPPAPRPANLLISNPRNSLLHQAIRPRSTSSQGLRYGRSSIAAASLSSRIVSRSESHRILRPVRNEILARWHATDV